MVALRQLGRDKWHRDYFKALNGEADGLFEIRFSADNVMQRLLRYFSGEREFTVLYWATEKNNRFVPKSAPLTALEWKRHAEMDRESTDAWWFALE